MSLTFLHVESIPSTNAYLLEHASDLDEFTFLDASYQTMGKGRGDHAWNSIAGENLLASLLLKQEPLLRLGGFLSPITAVVLAKLLEEEGLKDVSIKWPNDVYASGKKIAGILLQADLPRCLVIGVGVNLNQTSFEGDYAIPPTSFLLESGRACEVSSFKKRFGEALEKALLSDPFDPKPFLSYYENHDFLKDKTVELLGVKGVVLGVDESFALLLENEEGVHALVSGEAHLIVG